MNRSVMARALLLGAALVAAYFVWTREPDTSADNISILSLRAGLTAVRYEEPDLKVKIEKRKDDQGSYFWVRSEKMVKKPRKFTPPKSPAVKGPGRPSRPGRPGRPGSHAGHGHGHGPGDGHGHGRRHEPLNVTPPTKAATAKSPPARTPAAKSDKRGTTLNKDPKAKPETDKEPNASKTPPVRRVAPAKVAKKAPGKKAAIKKPVAKELKIKEFRGNETTEKLMKDLAEFSAVRVLGKVGPDKLKVFGLSESKSKLIVTIGKTDRTFVIGNKTQGNMDYYIQDSQDQRVYVVKPKELQNLKYAEYRLIDRRVYGFKATEADRVELAAKGKRKTLNQHNRLKKRDAFWSVSGDDKRNEQLTNWMTKLLRLRVSDYVKPGTNTATTELVLTATYFLGDKKLDTLKLYKVTKDLADDKDVKQGDYLVATAHTRASVKLTKSLADEVAREVKTLLATGD